MALILKHQSVEQFVSRVRAAYRDGQSDTLVKVARFILARLQAGDITDAQCRSAFGLNATQWTNLKARMQAITTAANTVAAAIGE